MEDACLLPLRRKFPDGPRHPSGSRRSDPASPAGWTCRAPPPGRTETRRCSEALARTSASPLKPGTRTDDQYWTTGTAGVSPRTPAPPAGPLRGWTRPRSSRTRRRSCRQRGTKRETFPGPVGHLNEAGTYNSSIPSGAVRWGGGGEGGGGDGERPRWRWWRRALLFPTMFWKLMSVCVPLSTQSGADAAATE